MKNRLVPRAVLFEPDRHNRVHLGANLLINGLRFDDFCGTGQTLAIKIDVERYEHKVLAGMARTLRDNRGIVQIEVLEAREETTALLSAAGFWLDRVSGPISFFGKIERLKPQVAPIRRR